jgi:hypothetical protein
MPVNAVKPGSERANDSCNDIPPQPTNCANKRYRQVYVTVPSSRTNPRGRVWWGLSLQIVATAAEQIHAQTLRSLRVCVCVCVRVSVQIHTLGQSYNNVHHSKGQKVKRSKEDDLDRRRGYATSCPPRRTSRCCLLVLAGGSRANKHASLPSPRTVQTD